MKRSGESGFTLLEVIISMTLLAIGMLALGALQAASVRGNGFAMNNTEGTALIEKKIEEYQATPWASLPSGNTTVVENNVGQGGRYTRTSVFQDNTPITNTKTVTVSVAWKDKASHSFSFQTILVK